MFTFTEMADKLRQLGDKYETYRANGLVEAALDAVDTAKDRVINDRVDDTGSIFDTYDPEYFKRKRNKTSENINFSDTNTMWSTTVPQIYSVTSSSVTIIIKPTDREREEIMGFHDERFGKPIITLNEIEQQQIIDDYNEGAIECLKEVGIL